MKDRWFPLTLVAMAVLSTSCATGSSPGPGAGSAGSAAAGHSAGECEGAPDWLVGVLQDGLVVRGATISNVYIRPTDGFSSGPPELQSQEFASAWWVAGKISGAGVRPEIGTWLTNRTSREGTGEILSVDAAAQRYSSWQVPDEPIKGPGSAEIRACVGPIPES